MPSRRQRQVAELLHREISQILQFQSQDPRLGAVTVTEVAVTQDLLLARVYVTVLGDELEAQEAMTGLNKAASFIRRRLGQTLSLRRVPDLTFQLDNSLDHAMRIENLLDKINTPTDTTDSIEHPSDLNLDD